LPAAVHLLSAAEHENISRPEPLGRAFKIDSRRLRLDDFQRNAEPFNLPDAER
jgi:hypothetical protein